MVDEKDLEFVREQLRKAAEIKDPKELWATVRDILILLSMILTPAEGVQVEIPERWGG